jgi:hypothetical protein
VCACVCVSCAWVVCACIRAVMIKAKTCGDIKVFVPFTCFCVWQFSTGGSSSCPSCLATLSLYSPTAGASECLTCPEGTFAFPASSQVAPEDGSACQTECPEYLPGFNLVGLIFNADSELEMAGTAFGGSPQQQLLIIQKTLTAIDTDGDEWISRVEAIEFIYRRGIAINSDQSQQPVWCIPLRPGSSGCPAKDTATGQFPDRTASAEILQGVENGCFLVGTFRMGSDPVRHIDFVQNRLRPADARAGDTSLPLVVATIRERDIEDWAQESFAVLAGSVGATIDLQTQQLIAEGRSLIIVVRCEQDQAASVSAGGSSVMTSMRIEAVGNETNATCAGETTNARYDPVDNVPGGGGRTTESTGAAGEAACKGRCAAVAGCAFWNFFTDGGCQLSASTSVLVSSNDGVRSGACTRFDGESV